MLSAGRAQRNGEVPAVGAIPESSLIMRAFTGDLCVDRDDGILAAAGHLAATHQRQWVAEDACRLPGAPVEEVGRLKRRIDELNARRTGLVEQIDIWAEERVRRSGDALLHTETLGSVIDRLAIAWVRAGSLDMAGDRLRARLARRQLAELAEAYDGLVREVAAGCRRLPAWRPLKTYAPACPS